MMKLTLNLPESGCSVIIQTSLSQQDLPSFFSSHITLVTALTNNTVIISSALANNNIFHLVMLLHSFVQSLVPQILASTLQAILNMTL